MEEQYIVTVDLGSSTIRLAVGKVADGKVEICFYNDYPSEGVSHGKVLNPSRVAGVLAKAKKDAEDYLGIKISDIAVNCQKNDIRSISSHVKLELSGNCCVDRQSLEMLEDLAHKDVEAKLGPNEDVLALVAQEFTLDDEMGISVDDVVGMSGQNLEGDYKIFIGKTVSLRQIDEACRATGIALHKNAFTPQYAGMCCLTGSEKESGVALVDLGSGASSVAVFYGGVLRHYGAIPFGGDSITADIRNLCSIDDVKLAENVKKAYGACMPDKLQSLSDKTLRITDIHTGIQTEITAKYISEVITARMKEIVDSILYEIQLSGYADTKLKNGIVLTGGLASTVNLSNFIKAESGFSSRIGSPARNLFESQLSTYYTSSSVTTAALLMFLAGQGVSCAEIYTAKPSVPEPAAAPAATPDEDAPIRDLFGDEIAPEKPKPSKKTGKGKRIGHWFDQQENKIDGFFNGWFGDSDDPANKI